MEDTGAAICWCFRLTRAAKEINSNTKYVSPPPSDGTIDGERRIRNSTKGGSSSRWDRAKELEPWGVNRRRRRSNSMQSGVNSFLGNYDALRHFLNEQGN